MQETRLQAYDRLVSCQNLDESLIGDAMLRGQHVPEPRIFSLTKDGHFGPQIHLAACPPPPKILAIKSEVALQYKYCGATIKAKILLFSV